MDVGHSGYAGARYICHICVVCCFLRLDTAIIIFFSCLRASLNGQMYLVLTLKLDPRVIAEYQVR
jgi:hypothetical protein